MKRSDRVLFAFLLVSGVFFVSAIIYRTGLSKNILGVQHTVKLDRKTFPFLPDASFVHYYEPEQGSKNRDFRDWLGHEVTYAINQAGFNSVNEYAQEKPPGTFRIAVLGDSFTFGLFVNTPENYPSVLETMLNGSCGQQHYEVLNAGVPGFDVAFSAYRYRFRVEPFHPDLLIWFMNYWTLMNDAERRITLEEQYRATVTAEEQLKQEKLHILDYPATRAYNDLFTRIPADQMIASQAGYLQEFVNYYSGPLLIIMNSIGDWPDPARVAVEHIAGERKNILMYPDVTALSGADLLADGHPSPSGHAKIAADIQKFLKDHSMIPCR